MKSLLVNIYQKGTFMVWLEEAKLFLNVVRSITESDATVNDGDLMNHYPVSVAHLETLFIKSCKKFDHSIVSSKELFNQF